MVKIEETVLNNETKILNSGTTESQVYFLTIRINEINEHLKKNPHDFAAKRGNICLIGRRNRLCKYFKKKYGESKYKEIIIEKIGLRK